jgi:hypothetical protein
MPDARLDIDSVCIAAKNVNAGDLPSIIEDEECQFTLKHQERLGLGRITVTVGCDVGATDHHAQEPMRVIVHAGMEVVIGAQPRRLARPLNQGENEG